MHLRFLQRRLLKFDIIVAWLLKFGMSVNENVTFGMANDSFILYK